MESNPPLLIDGDVFAYIAASAAQRDVTYPDGFVVRWANIQEGEAILDRMMLQIQSDFSTNVRLVFLTETDTDNPNWRHALFPEYKGNRAATERPQLLPALRAHMRDRWSAISEPGLEADDLLGIYATGPSRLFNGAIIVTKDKDLRCVPGRLHIMGRRDAAGRPHVETVTETQARLWHMTQALAGDRVDNFAGCPGIGMTSAKRILEKPVVLHPKDGTVTRGPRKGDHTTIWMSQPTTDLWACVVSHYLKAGLSEDDALTTARVSHILRYEDYDRDTKKVRLWEPYR